MPDIINNRLPMARRRGIALLVVLFVIMAITIISLGFLTRCDTELACGQNMLLRTQMDQLADSALEHAKGLILHPQDVDSEYWPGAAGQQLVAGSADYYDVSVTRDGSDPNDRRSYLITCEAYRLLDAQAVGRSGLSAQLRLDPCVALWTGADTVFRPGHVLQGDLRCTGAVVNLGTIDGDVFSSALTGTVTGRHRAVADLSLAWPPVAIAYANPEYPIDFIAPGTLAAVTYSPARIWRCTGDLVIANDVVINGMLSVVGNLTIRGDRNSLLAAKNLPALYVSGDLVIGEVDGLTIEGLVVVDGGVRISAAASNIAVVGGVFAKGTLTETAPDSSSGDHDCLVYDVPTWRPTGGQLQGALEFDGVNDYLRTPDSLTSVLLADDYTISVWLKPSATPKPRAAIVAKTDPSGLFNHWALQFDTGGSGELTVYYLLSSWYWRTGIMLQDVTAQGRWHHVAVTRHGTTMSSYLDGTRRKTGEYAIPPWPAYGHLNVAADRAARSDYLYAGLIDDLRIYDQAMDGNDLPPPDDLIGHWKLDESGSEVTITTEPTRSAIVAGLLSEEHWSQATGAFFRSIRRD
jgi:hypothetical protein